MAAPDRFKPKRQPATGVAINRPGMVEERKDAAPAQSNVMKDIESAKPFAQEMFGAGSLERMAAIGAEELAKQIQARQAQAATAGQRSADVQDIISRYRSGLEGYTAPELQALREQMQSGITTGEQTALRQLRGQQAAAGIQGGLAGAQAARLLQAGQQARTQAERDLFLQNIAQRQNALQGFQQAVTGAEATEFGRGQTTQGALEQILQQQRAEETGRQQFNIGQGQQEKFGQLATMLGIAGMGSTERAAEAEKIAGTETAKAIRQQAASQGKK